MRFVNLSDEGMTVTMRKNGAPTGSIQYSLDGKEWNTFNNFGTPYEVEYKQYADGRTELYDPNIGYDDEDAFDVIKVQVQEANIDPIPKGACVYFKGDYKGTGKSNYIKLTANKSHSVEGNIMSLTYGDDFEGKTTIENTYQYYRLFFGDTTLTDASGLLLPATTLAKGCYVYMFRECTALTAAPELPATTLAEECYDCMFALCSSLVTAPVLLATTLAYWCYNAMFAYCTKLNYIKCLATSISGKDNTEDWVLGITITTGTFVKKRGINWPEGKDGIPTGWRVEEVDA